MVASLLAAGGSGIAASTATAYGGYTAGICDSGGTCTEVDVPSETGVPVMQLVPATEQCYWSGAELPPIEIGESSVALCPEPQPFDHGLIDANVAGVQVRDRYSNDIYHSRQELRMGDTVLFLQAVYPRG